MAIKTLKNRVKVLKGKQRVSTLHLNQQEPPKGFNPDKDRLIVIDLDGWTEGTEYETDIARHVRASRQAAYHRLRGEGSTHTEIIALLAKSSLMGDMSFVSTAEDVNAGWDDLPDPDFEALLAQLPHQIERIEELTRLATGMELLQ